MIQADPVRVVDKQMNDVPRDGRTRGEIVMRGNNVMTGYFDDEKATDEAFRGGWPHSGDLGVAHSDGYVELRDQAEDIIISGGKNISAVEVGHTIESHPAVLEVAVVGVPDEKWGERPKAFVVRRPGAQVSEAELFAPVQVHRALQDAHGDRIRGQATANLDRKDPEVRAAREGMGWAQQPDPGLEAVPILWGGDNSAGTDDRAAGRGQGHAGARVTALFHNAQLHEHQAPAPSTRRSIAFEPVRNGADTAASAGLGPHIGQSQAP